MTNSHEILARRLTALGLHVDQLQVSEGWQTMLAFARRFHHYSMHNRFLIWAQRSDATRVAGEKTWKAMGRTRIRGERPIRILRPMFRPQWDPDSGDEELALSGFAEAHVFDVSQTEGDPVPELSWPLTENTPELFAAVVETVEAEGLHVHQLAPLDVQEGYEGLRGVYKAAERRILLMVPPTLALSTLLHELGHHFDSAVAGDVAAYRDHRAEAELVAESACWLVAQRLGLDTTLETVHYEAGWYGGVEVLLELSSRIGHVEKAMWKMLGHLVATDTEEAVA